MAKEKNDNIMSIKEAAKVLGRSEMTVREGLKDPDCYWYKAGYAYRKKGSKNYMYGVFRSKLEEIAGPIAPDKSEKDVKLIKIYSDELPDVKRA